MEYKAEPNCAVLIADPAKENTREYCRKRLGHWLLEMDHAIRHGHYQNRIYAERRPETVKQKTAKEKLQTEKLKKIDQLPDKQR